MDVDGVLVLINLTKPVSKGESCQDLKEGYNKNQSPTLKPIAPIPSPSLPSQYWSLQA